MEGQYGHIYTAMTQVFMSHFPSLTLDFRCILRLYCSLPFFYFFVWGADCVNKLMYTPLFVHVVVHDN